MSALLDAERKWRGEMGAAYWGRNPPKRNNVLRTAWWQRIRSDLQPRSVLEVGCGAGTTLRSFNGRLRAGVDIDERVLRLAPRGIHGVQASAGTLPFGDCSFDLVFTLGCLIHIPESALRAALREIGRVAREFVLLCEYEDTERREIPWHGERDVLFADYFGLKFWMQNHGFLPEWVKELGAAQGFDRVTAMLFSRRDDAR